MFISVETVAASLDEAYSLELALTKEIETIIATRNSAADPIIIILFIKKVVLVNMLNNVFRNVVTL